MYYVKAYPHSSVKVRISHGQRAISTCASFPWGGGESLWFHLCKYHIMKARWFCWIILNVITSRLVMSESFGRDWKLASAGSSSSLAMANEGNPQMGRRRLCTFGSRFLGKLSVTLYHPFTLSPLSPLVGDDASLNAIQTFGQCSSSTRPLSRIEESFLYWCWYRITLGSNMGGLEI